LAETNLHASGYSLLPLSLPHPLLPLPSPYRCLKKNAKEKRTNLMELRTKKWKKKGKWTLEGNYYFCGSVFCGCDEA
jgi:hypothetical protein